MTDGLFGATGSQLRFHPARLGEIDFTAVQRAIRHRVLRTAGRRGCLTPDAIADLEASKEGESRKLAEALQKLFGLKG